MKVTLTYIAVSLLFEVVPSEAKLGGPSRPKKQLNGAVQPNRMLAAPLKEYVCHKGDEGVYHNLHVNEDAVEQHLNNHDDYLGTCEGQDFCENCETSDPCTVDICEWVEVGPNSFLPNCTNVPTTCGDGYHCDDSTGDCVPTCECSVSNYEELKTALEALNVMDISVCPGTITWPTNEKITLPPDIQKLVTCPCAGGCEFFGNKSVRNAMDLDSMIYGYKHDLTFDGITFSNSVRALMLFDGQATFTNCDFEENDSSVNNVVGGALYISKGTTSFEDCTFTGNKGTEGGALLLAGGSVVYISSCTFQRNQAPRPGSGGGSAGAIMVRSSGVVLHITNSLFVNNDAVMNGGALYVSNGVVSIDQVTFDSNTCHYEWFPTTCGGAMYVTGGLSEITCINANNFVGNGGGDIAVSSGSPPLSIGSNCPLPVFA